MADLPLHARQGSLRVAAMWALDVWIGDYDAVKELSDLLGFKDYDDFVKNQTEDVNRVLLLLAGEHGYAVYKMLLARKEAS